MYTNFTGRWWWSESRKGRGPPSQAGSPRRPNEMNRMSLTSALFFKFLLAI
jgi:hypothetical protein